MFIKQQHFRAQILQTEGLGSGPSSSTQQLVTILNKVLDLLYFICRMGMLVVCASQGCFELSCVNNFKQCMTHIMCFVKCQLIILFNVSSALFDRLLSESGEERGCRRDSVRSRDTGSAVFIPNSKSEPQRGKKNSAYYLEEHNMIFGVVTALGFRTSRVSSLWECQETVQLSWRDQHQCCW